MESQAIRGSLSNVRLEPTMLESEARVAMDEAIPAFGTDPSQPERRGPERALAERYLLRGRISEGHLGEVYEAIDLQLSAAGRKDHCVALELVTLSGSQADVRQHLASEFKDLLSISHPNIARIVDFGVDGTRHSSRPSFLKAYHSGLLWTAIPRIRPRRASCWQSFVAWPMG